MLKNQQNNPVMIKSFFLVFIVFLFSGTGRALAVGGSDDVPVVKERHFNREALNNYLADEDFFYVENQEAKTNFIQEMRAWLFNLLRRIIGSPASNFILSNLHFILLAVVLFLIFYKISGLSLEKSGYREKHYDAGSMDFDTTQIEEIDFRPLIREAVEKNDFRLAVRYQYLDVLKTLSALGLISHLQYKSNVEYLYELKDKKLKNGFRHLVFVFDHVWYGDYQPDRQQYQKIDQEFDVFKRQIPRVNGGENETAR